MFSSGVRELPFAVGVKRVVYQCVAGEPKPNVKETSQRISRWLATNGIETKTFGASALHDVNVLPIQALPQHKDFILVLHDCGNETSEDYNQLVGLNAPTILVHSSVNENTRSLTRWAFARVALGTDPIATLALRVSGFQNAASLLFPEIKATEPTARIARTSFNVVAPGNLTPENNGQTIIQAFDRLRQSIARPSQLYFMGCTMHAGTAKSLEEEIQALDLSSFVTITGQQDFAAKKRILAESDLCVVLGIPKPPLETLFQAIISGLAVLAPPLPTIAYNLGGAALEQMHPTVEQLAERMLHFAEIPDALANLSEAQYRHLAATQNDDQAAKVLWNALGRCGLNISGPPFERELVSSQLGFIVAGHFEGSYSISAVNRDLATALEHRRPGSVSIVPVALLQPIATLNDVPPEKAKILENLFVRKTPNGMPIVAVSQHFPPWKPNFPNDLAISLFTWEETLIPPEMVDMLNSSFDGIIAVSRFVAKTLIDSGVRVPVGLVGQPVDAPSYLAVAAERSIHGRLSDTMPFTALHVSSCFPRKGPDVLLAAWAAAFSSDDQVRLLIKTFPNQHNHIAQGLENLRAAFPNHAPVEIIERDLVQRDLIALYRAADCMVLPTRGEGFNMVAAEALLADLPLIVTEFSGHLDFIDGKNVRRLDYTLEASGSHVTSDGALWANPDLEDLITALREAYAAFQLGRSFATAVVTNAARAEQFDSAHWANRIADFATDLFLNPPPILKRLVWISSWAVRCGIAEYSKALLDHRRPDQLSTEILVLCDNRTSNAIDLFDLEAVSVSPVWQLGGGQIASEIAAELNAFDPQLLVIQHQAGLISWEDLVAIVSLAHGVKRRVVVMLHSTHAIYALPHVLQASVLFALSLVSRVIVHTVGDVNNLHGLGLADNVTLLPHGAVACKTERRQQLRRDRKIIGCYGFFLPHKGIAKLIEAFADLRVHFPSARLRLVNATFPSQSSSGEIKFCRRLAQRLKVYDGIDWHIDYLDEVNSKALLEDCDVIVLPYDQTMESVSGAVRQALASGSPVAVSENAIFAELGNAVHRIDAGDASRLSKGLLLLLNDPVLCKSTLEAAANWLDRHDWHNVSKRLFYMLEGVFRDIGPTCNILVLSASHHLLGTEIGQFVGKSIYFSESPAGYGLYGPFVNLPAGNYRVIYRFDTSTTLSGTVHFDAYSQIGALRMPLGDRTLEPSELADYNIEILFRLLRPEHAVELRMFCDAGFNGRLQSISIQLLAE